jgi:hypothetical protein
MPCIVGRHKKDDTAADYPLVLCVSGGADHRDLLHACDRAARHGSTGRWSSGWLAGAGRDRSMRGPWLVASTICLDAILPAAFLPRPLALAGANLPRNVAVGPTVWLARPGGVRWYRGGHWPAVRLPDRGDVPAVDAVRTWLGSHPGGWRYLYRYGGPGTCRHASYRRPRQWGRVGENANGSSRNSGMKDGQA